VSATNDRREYVRVMVDLPMHPKLATIDDPHAGWLYVVSLCYCGEHLTDGVFVLGAVTRMAGVDREIGKRLLSEGMWHEQGHECDRCPQPPEGQLIVHDYLRHQRSRSDAEKVRAAGRKAADARWGAGRKRSASDPHAEPNADRMRIASEPQCDSDATPNAEVEVEVEVEKDLHSPSVGGSGGDASQHAAPPKEARKRATRIRPDWTPSPAKRTSLTGRFQRPDPWWLNETEKFVNHFIQKAGKDATSLDWDARFDNWIRSAVEREGTRPMAGGHRSTTNERVAQATSLLDWAAELDAKDEATALDQPARLAIGGPA